MLKGVGTRFKIRTYSVGQQNNSGFTMSLLYQCYIIRAAIVVKKSPSGRFASQLDEPRTSF